MSDTLQHIFYIARAHGMDADAHFVQSLMNGFDKSVVRLFLHEAINGHEFRAKHRQYFRFLSNLSQHGYQAIETVNRRD